MPSLLRVFLGAQYATTVPCRNPHLAASASQPSAPWWPDHAAGYTAPAAAPGVRHGRAGTPAAAAPHRVRRPPGSQVGGRRPGQRIEHRLARGHAPGQHVRHAPGPHQHRRALPRTACSSVPRRSQRRPGDGETPSSVHPAADASRAAASHPLLPVTSISRPPGRATTRQRLSSSPRSSGAPALARMTTAPHRLRCEPENPGRALARQQPQRLTHQQLPPRPGAGTSTPCSSARRRRAVAAYSADSSTPVKLRPSRSAATPVDPEPAKGSRTSPPGTQIRTSSCIRDTGLAVMWCWSTPPRPARSSPRPAGHPR